MIKVLFITVKRLGIICTSLSRLFTINLVIHKIMVFFHNIIHNLKGGFALGFCINLSRKVAPVLDISPFATTITTNVLLIEVLGG